MKILHIIQGLAIGGAEKLLVDTLPKYGEKYETHLLILKKPDENNIYYNMLKNKVIIHISPHKNPKSFKNLFYIRKLIKKEKYNIVHSHLLLDRYFAILSTVMMFNKPILITTVHNLINPKKEKFLSRFIYNRYNKIIAISEGTRKSVLKNTSKKQKDVITIYNGIDFSNFNKVNINSDIRKELGIRDEDIILLMVGRFSDQKDQNTIIKALRILPNKYKLVLVGDGEQRENSKKLVKELKLNDRVNFLGLRSDVPDITKAADIVIVSSNWEGFGLVAVEGMASEKPVIGTNVPGLDEVIQLKEMLFTVGDYEDLANIIISLEDEELYNVISNKMFKLSKEFSIENMIEKHLDLYKEVSKNSY